MNTFSKFILIGFISLSGSTCFAQAQFDINSSRVVDAKLVLDEPIVLNEENKRSKITDSMGVVRIELRDESLNSKNISFKVAVKASLLNLSITSLMLDGCGYKNFNLFGVEGKKYEEFFGRYVDLENNFLEKDNDPTYYISSSSTTVESSYSYSTINVVNNSDIRVVGEPENLDPKYNDSYSKCYNDFASGGVDFHWNSEDRSEDFLHIEIKKPELVDDQKIYIDNSRNADSISIINDGETLQTFIIR